MDADYVRRSHLSIAEEKDLRDRVTAAEAALAARDETIRGLKERTLTDDDLYTLMCAAENLRSADHDESRADAAFRIASQIDKLRARATLNSTEPSDD